MQAAVLRGGQLVVDEVPDPVPQPGQLLVRTLACGICGSDLHTVHHGEEMVALTRIGEADALAAGLPAPQRMDLSRDVVMGHEFCAEVVEAGENTVHQVGEIVVSMPIAFDPIGIHALGYSNHLPGGYGELMVLSDPLAITVPTGVDPHLAALTEPMAVGLHAVNRSSIATNGAAVVLGCGPVGLAVIAALTAKGVACIVAADFSPARRALAAGFGAHEVVDPRDEPAVQAWRRVDGRRRLTIFEAVGVGGMIDRAMTDAPRRSEIVVVGVCMAPDTIRPGFGVVKELTLRFAFGYDPAEFAQTLTQISDGTLDVSPMITGRVPVAGIPDAFVALADPEAHAKILVCP
jgi:2-desacetyl-2-hydroxyethyl bacteriochlorophyllide A dehydrogenase